MKLKTALLLAAFLCLQKIQSQDGIIHLGNPSFEGEPRLGTVNGPLPDHWANCSFSGESVPDVHSAAGSPELGISQLPSEGNTFLGMVVRDNQSWERVGQHLPSPMLANRKYVFSLDLCRSKIFNSMSRKNNAGASFASPCKLRIWGGHSVCDRAELLAESGLVANLEWQQYAFVLPPSKDYSHLILEAFYETEMAFPYNGNILLDNASALIPFGSRAILAQPTATAKELLVQQFEFTDTLFGAAVQLRLYANTDSLAHVFSQAAFDRAHAIEQAVTEGLAALHASKGEKTKLNDDTWQLLQFAKTAHQQTRAAFDVARTDLVADTWLKMTKQFDRIPNQLEVARLLDRSGTQNLIFSKKQSVKFKTRSLEFNLVDLAKAYALDEMAKLLQTSGHGMFSLHLENMAIAGLDSFDDERTVFRQGEMLREVVSLSGAAVCTSGPGELFFEQDGTQYFDVFLPRNGQAVTGQRIVTVKAASCMDALAYSKALAADYDLNLVEALRQNGLIEHWSSEP